jgi:hypothetical protein
MLPAIMTIDMLRPALGSTRLTKKHGVWVLRARQPLAKDVVETTIREIRRDREEQITGKKRSKKR